RATLCDAARLESDREDILEVRWYHARNAGWTEAIRSEATHLMRLYQRQNRSNALLRILESVVSEQRYIPADLKIAAAWAYLKVGDPSSEKSGFKLVIPADLEASQAATWYHARAEIAKASGQAGSKAEARRFLDQALSEIAAADGTERQRLRIKQDIARLVH